MQAVQHAFGLFTSVEEGSTLGGSETSSMLGAVKQPRTEANVLLPAGHEPSSPASRQALGHTVAFNMQKSFTLNPAVPMLT